MASLAFNLVAIVLIGVANIDMTPNWTVVTGVALQLLLAAAPTAALIGLRTRHASLLLPLLAVDILACAFCVLLAIVCIALAPLTQPRNAPLALLAALIPGAIAYAFGARTVWRCWQWHWLTAALQAHGVLVANSSSRRPSIERV